MSTAPATPPPTSPVVLSAIQNMGGPTSPMRGPASPARAPLGPNAARFKRAALKLMTMRRASTLVSQVPIGAEPGVDPRKPGAHLLYGHLKQACQVEVVDYNSVRATTKSFDNSGFINWVGSAQHEREPWVKVRWIHVNGVSWDIMAALALNYDIHPLALEDVLHSRESSRSKASYFSKHLFLRVLAHSVGGWTPTQAPITPYPRSSSPVEFEDKYDDPDATLGKNTPNGSGSVFNRKPMSKTSSDLESKASIPLRQLTPDTKDLKRRQREAKLDVLKDEGRVKVDLTNLHIFLWRDGTVVSIYGKPGSDFAQPISMRLRARDTILRSSADASLLVESMLDMVVDEVLEMIDEYNDEIKEIEQAILTKPKMRFVRRLHILSGDLSMRKRSLEPIKTLIYGLRTFDQERCEAVAHSSGTAKDQEEVVGFISHRAKIYLSDVNDHMEYALTSMELFAAISENLISYTFNLSGYMTNETMRRLTLITMICLPLTLLTGYFGMNFDNMWAIHHGHTDVVFWIIALPLLVIVLPLFLAHDITRGLHYVQKRMLTKQASQAVVKANKKR